MESANQMRWRARLIGSKLGGELPETSWPTIALSLIPERLFHRWKEAVWQIPPITGDVAMIRREGPFVLWRSRLGDFWAGYKDGRLIDILVEEQLDKRAYELEPVCLREGDVVIDAGAHLGAFTRFALVRKARKVIAFEPSGRLVECYRRTFAEEIRSGRVQLVNAAVWNKRETLRFDVSAGNSAAGHLSPEGQVEVPAVTIDDTLDELGVDQVDFIKMDTEGAERYALPGAARTIRKYRPRMAICSYHLLDDVEVLPRTVFDIAPEYQVVRRRNQDYYYVA